MASAGKTIRQQLKSLELHLKRENPVLVTAVESYRHLDQVGRTLGLLDSEQSYATQISWWPMISVLGTFSAGKSTFINHFLDYQLQATGNQAVDDKFTVMCFASEGEPHILPGSALDADPRFPFYRISNELEKVAKGEGRRVDAYLQLKTCPSEKLRGRIFIDSPGFDADSQRTAILRLTDHIVDLSDLVLVFFDARHPEPGAMRDTLSHLVGNTIHRPDATKFVYILNQMDTTAREDNPEDVVGAWQRALAQEGLTAGRFYMIYNPNVAVPIEDESLKKRYESKRDHDLAEIHDRIQRVGVERAYRITGSLEKLARHIEEKQIPRLVEYKSRWRRLVLIGDGLILAGLALIGLPVTSLLGLRDGWRFGSPDWWQGSAGDIASMLIVLTVVIGAYVWLHFRVRNIAAHHVNKQIGKDYVPGLEHERMSQAFMHNTRGWHSIFRLKPVGWGNRSRKRLHRVIAEAHAYVQTLNDTFTDPSGEHVSETTPTPPLAVVEPISREGETDKTGDPDEVQRNPG
ncbi:MAG: dynamin family protein [Pseudomonadota bacterium]